MTTPLLRRLSTASKPPTITISKAKCMLQSEHDPDKALAIYASISSSSATSSSPLSSRATQDLTVRRLAKFRRFSDIETLLESHKTNPNITQEPYLSTLIRSYGLAGMPRHALDTFNQMESLGTKRSATSFNALLSAFARSKKFDEVPRLFDEMPRRFNFKPDRVSYGVLVKSYCGSGELGKAIEIVREMEKKGVEVTGVTYTTLLSGLCKSGKSEEAEWVWEEMTNKGCVLDVAAYNVRMMGLGSPEEVTGLIEEMKKKGLVPDTISYNYLMTCYCKYGMMKEAKKVYEELEGNGCKANGASFRTLVFYFCKYGDFEKGYKVFKESVAVHKIPDFNTLKHLVRGLVASKRMKDAKRMCRTMKKKFPDSFLNAWRKLEEELGLSVDPSSSIVEDGVVGS